MCDQCEPCDQQCPTAGEAGAVVRAQLEHRRFTMLSVGGSRHCAEFSYTIGLTRHGVPRADRHRGASG